MEQEILLIGRRVDPTDLAEMTGCKVIHAEDYLEGLHLFKQHEPCAVVLSMGCPHKTLETVIGFRENRLPEARFLALVDLEPRAMPAFRRRIGVYGVQEVGPTDLGHRRLEAALSRLIGTTCADCSASI